MMRVLEVQGAQGALVPMLQPEVVGTPICVGLEVVSEGLAASQRTAS